jgi:hypothetical protein
LALSASRDVFVIHNLIRVRHRVRHKGTSNRLRSPIGETASAHEFDTGFIPNEYVFPNSEISPGGRHSRSDAGRSPGTRVGENSNSPQDASDCRFAACVKRQRNAPFNVLTCQRVDLRFGCLLPFGIARNDKGVGESPTTWLPTRHQCAEAALGNGYGRADYRSSEEVPCVATAQEDLYPPNFAIMTDRPAAASGCKSQLLASCS